MTNSLTVFCEKPSLLCFTDLPFVIRRRIYIMAGLVRVCPISLNTEGAQADRAKYLEECKYWWLFDEGHRSIDMDKLSSYRCFYRHKRFMNETINVSAGGIDCICTPLPYALLRVSHVISNEVLAILYSENLFRVCRSDSGGLTSLLTISPAALRYITSISIRLNACPCIPRHQCPVQSQIETRCSECHGTCRLGKDSPISLNQPDCLIYLSEWMELCRRLALYAYPRKLRLSVVCDTLDYATAKRTTEPLLELPQLAECSIRLGQTPDSGLGYLAQETVYRLTRKKVHNPIQSFSFSALPMEIQAHILSYTDLISPDTISWYYKIGIDFFTSCCLRCTDALEACCCSALHAAYTSMPCECWVMPSPIFLVSKKIRELALEIFFSRNKFQIWPERSETGSHPDSLHILAFLRGIPNEALKHIRCLELKLDGLDYHLLGPGTDFQNDWNATVDFISRNLDISRLCLSIEDLWERPIRDSYYITGNYSSAEAAEDEHQEPILCQNLGAPLSKLKGVKDFSIRFAGRRSLKAFHRKQETILERRIMGELYDDSVEANRGEKRQEQGNKSNKFGNEPVFGPDGTQIWPLEY